MALHVDYEIRWKNYRAFADTGWIKIRPLTILLGANNSGKSSILSPLLLMSQTISSRDTVTPLVTRGALTDVGTYSEFIHDRDKSKQLFFGFRFHVHDPNQETKEVGSYPPGALEIVFESGDQPHEIILKSFRIFDIYKRLYLRRSLRETNKFSFFGVMKKGSMTHSEQMALERARPTNFLFSPASTLYEYSFKEKDESEGSPREFSKEFSHYLSVIGFVFEQVRSILGALSYIGPLREKPQRFYMSSGEMPGSVGASGENTANLLKKRKKDFDKNLGKWLKKFEFGNGIEIKNLSDTLFSL